MTRRKPLSRRTFLRGTLGGATLALGLPPLEAMLSPRGAWAEGEGAPPFFGVFYWANGLPWHAAHGAEQAGPPDEWTPSGASASSVLLRPLERHQVSVITGLRPWTDIPGPPTYAAGQSDGHMRGFMVSLTGDRPRPEGFDHGSHTLTALRQSIDQHVARHPEFYPTTPRFRSIEVGVSAARFHDYGHWNAISYNGPESLNLPLMQSSSLFDLLFSAPPNAETAARQGRMLDAVLEDASSLRARLGIDDRQRLDAHLEHIYGIQNRLMPGAGCESPPRPADGGNLHEKTHAMAELLATAVNCGLTRAFSFMLTSPATTHTFSNLGVPDGMHKTCHDGHLDRVRNITIHQMEAFALFLDAFAAVPNLTGGTLLDEGLIYGTSEYGEGWKHSVNELPVVLAGTARGRLNPGVHTREPGGNLGRAQLTALKALGLPDESFGWNGAETTDPMSSLLV